MLIQITTPYLILGHNGLMRSNPSRNFIADFLWCHLLSIYLSNYKGLFRTEMCTFLSCMGHCGICELDQLDRVLSLWEDKPTNNKETDGLQTSATLSNMVCLYYIDVIMTTMTSQITSLTLVYSIVYSGADQRKHQSSASLAFVRGIHQWPVNSPHKGPVTRKCFHLITSSWPDIAWYSWCAI